MINDDSTMQDIGEFLDYVDEHHCLPEKDEAWKAYVSQQLTDIWVMLGRLAGHTKLPDIKE